MLLVHDKQIQCVSRVLTAVRYIDRVILTFRDEDVYCDRFDGVVVKYKSQSIVQWCQSFPDTGGPIRAIGGEETRLFSGP